MQTITDLIKAYKTSITKIQFHEKNKTKPTKDEEQKPLNILEQDHDDSHIKSDNIVSGILDSQCCCSRNITLVIRRQCKVFLK